MKAKTFENLIRKVVREEIDYALNREIKSLKEDLIQQQPIINEQPLPNNIKSSLKEKILGKKNIPKKSFASDSTLNDLLNETAQGDTNLNSGMSPIHMEGDFSNIGGMPVEAAPKAVQEAVTRDYSSLMKAIEKRKNN